MPDHRLIPDNNKYLEVQKFSFPNLIRISERYLFYYLQLIYWHFIEILWLFIFIIFYFSKESVEG